LSIEAILETVAGLGCRLVEITGGEPLLQDDTPLLCRSFLDAGYTVLVETNGSLDISKLPPQCVRIMDVKCPASGMAERFYMQNIEHVRGGDECKFVISSRDDFDWAVEFVKNHGLAKRCTVLFSPNTKGVSSRELAQWICEAGTPVRLNVQLHKVIWGEDKRGV
jgi:7-carboxy-7-deazaguanine synthase